MPYESCCCFVEAKNAAMVSPPQSSNQRAPPIGPVTPGSDPEKRDQIHNLSSPPLTFVSSPPPSNVAFDTAHTPKESVFDAFAPGPTKFMLAPPKCRKFMQDSGTCVVRRLNFACSKDLMRDMNHESSRKTISDEDHLFQSLYTTILDAIVSEHTKERVAKLPAQVSDSDGFRTPKFPPSLNGVAETCPGAPVKSKSRYTNIDMELCRKLEF
ncbi:hypothetical protein BUALT_Bualt09G0139600 [Buddleja alternifolia]|uniref:Uncharacterized protein n=1 Tax=Buddleja alternifolia TaxID=168488 RepID=A0AAV6XDF3_9LAMI|nr:hypothetical protein BUALT_Bualt09G0139600 [Buddleja alternifolia]